VTFFSIKHSVKLIFKYRQVSIIRGRDGGHRTYPYFDVVVGLAWSNDPESYASGRVATGRVSLAGQAKGDDPD
jgi:hypothetical protein